jgi:hypothetical protein
MNNAATDSASSYSLWGLGLPIFGGTVIAFLTW